MKLGKKVKKVHKLPKPTKVKNWPTPKAVPAERPQKKEQEIR